MNLPKGWIAITAGHLHKDTDEEQIDLILASDDGTFWSLIGRGGTITEALGERLLWSLEPPPDREGLARALYEAGSKALVALPWVNIPRPVVEAWLSVADTAIRLCGGVREAIEPREPFHITADRIAKEATDLRAELTRERLATRAAIESRDLANEEVGALRDGIQRIKGDLADAQQEARVLRDRIKFLEANLQQVHHDRDAQRAVVDHLRDIIVDIARGQR